MVLDASIQGLVHIVHLLIEAGNGVLRGVYHTPAGLDRMWVFIGRVLLFLQDSLREGNRGWDEGVPMEPPSVFSCTLCASAVLHCKG